MLWCRLWWETVLRAVDFSPFRSRLAVAWPHHTAFTRCMHHPRRSSQALHTQQAVHWTRVGWGMGPLGVPTELVVHLRCLWYPGEAGELSGAAHGHHRRWTTQAPCRPHSMSRAMRSPGSHHHPAPDAAACLGSRGSQQAGARWTEVFRSSPLRSSSSAEARADPDHAARAGTLTLTGCGR